MSAALWVLVGFGSAILLAVVIALVGVYIYRVRLITNRVGSFEMAILKPQGGWASGIGLYTESYLEWHPTVSLSLRPKLKLRRGVLEFGIPQGSTAVVQVKITEGRRVVVTRMSSPSFNAMISWSNSAPPPSEVF